MRRIGVLLAAGRGRRMGRTKQLVAWRSADDGPKPLVAAAYDAIHPICGEMIVVLGHEANAVAAALAQRPFHRAHGDPDAPMFESIRAGLRAAQTIDPTAVVVLQPADHPEAAPSTLATLAERSLQHPSQAVVPAYRGRGGHPIAIPPPVISLVIQSHCPTGLAGFWSTHPQLCHRVPVDDPAILRDIDTKNDLKRD